MNEIERAIETQQKLIKQWENRVKDLEKTISKYPWGRDGREYDFGDWRETELKRRKEQIEIALITISALEKQINGGWVPTSERLPEEYGSYLVAWMPLGESSEYIKQKTVSNTPHYYEILEFDPEDESGWIEDIKQCDKYLIIAWMSLPEPYKEDSQ